MPEPVDGVDVGAPGEQQLGHGRLPKRGDLVERGRPTVVTHVDACTRVEQLRVEAGCPIEAERPRVSARHIVGNPGPGRAQQVGELLSSRRQRARSSQRESSVWVASAFGVVDIPGHLSGNPAPGQLSPLSDALSACTR